MTNSISDRIATVQGSQSRRSEFDTAPHDLTSNTASPRTGTASCLDLDLCQLILAQRRFGEGLVIGSTRLAPWNEQTQATFLKFGEMLSSSLGTQKSLTIIPWKVLGENSDTSILSLGTQESRFEPTLISRLLRELPIWKKQSSLVLVELGRLNSDLARSISSWCNVTVLLSHGALPEQTQDLRAIRTWCEAGHPMNAAVHVA